MNRYQINWIEEFKHLHSSLVQCIVWYLANILFICLTKLQVLSNIIYYIYLSFYFLLSLHLYWSLWHLSMKKNNKIDNMILSYCQTAEAVSRLLPFLTGPVRCACPSLANCQGRTWRQLLCLAFVPLSRRSMGQQIAATSLLHSCWWQTNALWRGAWRTQQYNFLFYIHFIWMVFTQSIFEITFASIIYYLLLSISGNIWYWHTCIHISHVLFLDKTCFACIMYICTTLLAIHQYNIQWSMWFNIYMYMILWLLVLFVILFM